MKLTENIKRLKSGEWTDGFDKEFDVYLSNCQNECFAYNSLPPSQKDEKQAIIRRLFGSIGERFVLNSPFNCDFGFNIHVGENFIGNFNLTILDEAEVIIGDNVFIGPNTSLCTVIHSLIPKERNAGQMCAKPIVIGNNVWIASNVVVLPGVTIGDGAVVGAGSVVTKNVEAGTLVVGNPARKIKDIPQ